MKIFQILFYFFVIDFILLNTKVFKQVKQASTQRNLHEEASNKYTQYMADIMQVRAEKLNLDRELIQKDITRLKKDPIFKHKGVYGVVPQGKQGRLKVIHNIEQIVNKRPAKLTKTIKNRYTQRKPNPSQQKCGLWVKVGYMQFYPGFKQSRVKLIFRSNCMVGPEIKYFILKKQDYIPEFLEFKIGDKIFKIKYDKNSFSSRGYGIHMQQQFHRYKLYSFFKVKYKLTRDQKEEIRRKQIEINKNKCLATCRRQKRHRRTICIQRCQLRHRYVKKSRYLQQISLDKNQEENLNLQKVEKQQNNKENIQQNEKIQKDVNQERQLKDTDNDDKQQQNLDKKDQKNQQISNERNLKLTTSQNKNKKDRGLRDKCDCRYCNRKRFPIERRYCMRACKANCNKIQNQLNSSDIAVLHIPYKQALNEDEILSPGHHENQSGYFSYQIVDAIWNSSSVVNSFRKTLGERSRYIIITKYRGRPRVKNLLRNRCVIYGNLA